MTISRPQAICMLVTFLVAMFWVKEFLSWYIAATGFPGFLVWVGACLAIALYIDRK
jgi:hypothetical protein